MALTPEHTNLLSQREIFVSNTFRDIMTRIPDTVTFAKIESKDADMAKTPEGKFVLTYLLAARDLLKPALLDLTNVAPDLLVSRGGKPHNPERNIDTVGTEIIRELARRTTDLPHFWMRTEESADWQRLSPEDADQTDGLRFAVVDPLDMTSAIARKDRIQTTGLAIYDRYGELKSLGIQSLVDHGFIFVENIGGTMQIHHEGRITEPAQTAEEPLRIAAKSRRMETMNKLPLFTRGNRWVLDCDSGYAILGLHEGSADVVLDITAGSLWYEVVIWVRLAQALGLPVSDKNGNPIDLSAVMRHVIDKHEDDSYRIPFVISRTPEIHEKVLGLLTNE